MLWARAGRPRLTRGTLGIKGERLHEVIDTCAHLYLALLEEPQDNRLRLVVEEARAIGEGVSEEIAGAAVAGVRRIEHDPSCRAFQLYWRKYVAYQVWDECWAQPDEPGTYTGRLLRRYTTSPYLRYVAEGSTQPLVHVGVLCLNHCIDVVSEVPPQIEMIKYGRPAIVPDA